MIRTLTGDCRDVLPTLADASVQCCVTSPPYFGLRDYGTAQWDGGNDECDHARQSSVSRASSGLEGATATQGGAVAYRTTCGRCGATRIDRQIGLEPSPDAHIAELVSVFREVKRVLKPDGVCFINLGDSYCSATQCVRTCFKASAGIKPKDLLMIPARVALALQADGWWLRSQIVWCKPNAMPESVRDRPTSAYEMVYLLTKSARYYYDAQGHDVVNAPVRNARNWWVIATQPYSGSHFAVMPATLVERCIKAGSRPGDTILDPFSGAGTTAMVADRLGRDAIGIELNPTYSAMARDRVVDDCPLFAEVAAS